MQIPNFANESAQPPSNATADVQPAATLGKILVVDDNNLVARTISLKLRGAGYQAEAALDGPEALSAVRREKPDLIVLDIIFADDWDGFRIMEWLHRMDETRNIPIIIITSSEDVEKEERARAAGAAAFFRKPINHDELLKVIHTLLGSSAAKVA